jgi:hypothetical protein
MNSFAAKVRHFQPKALILLSLGADLKKEAVQKKG